MTSDFNVFRFSDGEQIGTGVASIEVTGLTPVPEPSSLALMFVGLAGIAGVRLGRR